MWIFFRKILEISSCLMTTQPRYGWVFWKLAVSSGNYFLETGSQFSHSVVSNSLQPHGLQYTRLPCPSPTLRACSNACPLSQWCHPTISSSVIPFSSHLQSFPASGSFPMSQFFESGGQSSFSISPSNEYSGLISFRMDWLDLLAVHGLSRVFSNTTVQKHQFFSAQLSL